MPHTALLTVPPSEVEAVLAKETRRDLASRLRKGRPYASSGSSEILREKLCRYLCRLWASSFLGLKNWPGEIR